jgi:REP element-mobilizing transposase RayT
MAKLLGYMITWTTYGSWLPGDKRGYVKGAVILDGDENLFQICRKQQKGPSVKLQYKEKQIVQAAVLNEAERIGHTIKALAVCSNHVHLTATPCNRSIEQIVSMYKSAATRALRNVGRTGKLWTKGFYKTFCYTAEEMSVKTAYVQRHN